MTENANTHLLMVRPAHLDYNPYTASSNVFQKKSALAMPPDEKQSKALQEFDEMVLRLRAAGITIQIIEDSPEPIKTDAVFPNNWVTFHEDGTVILYPMFAPNRRPEKRQDILEALSHHFYIREVIDLSHFEEKDQFLEATGSMVLDRFNQMAYAAYSVRTHDAVLDEFEKLTGYQSIRFRAEDDNGQAIYHTNVMMHIGSHLAIICLESIPQENERAQLVASLQEANKEIVPISLNQMKAFAGNMLELKGNEGQYFTVMSAQAYQSLDSFQIWQIEQRTKIIPIPLFTIEENGGGSARCMMAEIFLPQARAKRTKTF